MKYLIAAFYGLIVLGGLVNGGINFSRAANDAKASTPDVAWGVMEGVGSWWGSGALAALVHFVWSNRDKKPAPIVKRDDSKSPASATVMELHNADIDIQCVLRGDAESDAEGLKRIGAVLDYYASRKGAAK